MYCQGMPSVCVLSKVKTKRRARHLVFYLFICFPTTVTYSHLAQPMQSHPPTKIGKIRWKPRENFPWSPSIIRSVSRWGQLDGSMASLDLVPSFGTSMSKSIPWPYGMEKKTEIRQGTFFFLCELEGVTPKTKTTLHTTTHHSQLLATSGKSGPRRATNSIYIFLATWFMHDEEAPRLAREAYEMEAGR